MALNKILCLAFMFCFVHKAASQISTDAELILTPQYLYIDHHLALDGGTVTVQCKAVSVGLNEVIRSIVIKRAKAGGSSEDLVQIYSGDTAPDVKDFPGMSATASIADGGEKFITLTMERTTCEDAGNYTCEMQVTKSGEDRKVLEKMTSLNVEVKPGNVTLKATPSFQTYDVNETLTMLCNGPVGTVIDNKPVVTWMWQSRNLTVYPITNNNIDEIGWVKVENDTDNVVYKDEGEPIPEPNACYESRKSKLTMTLFKKDSNRMFRCFVRRNGMEYKQFADYYTVGTVRDPQETTTPGSDGGDSGDSQPSKSSIGPIIGGIAAALVVIIVIIVIVVCVVKRRNANKDTYGDPGNKPTDDPNGPPYPTPAVTYSQPNRFPRNDREPYGVTNKGMDRDSPRDHHQPRSKEPSCPTDKPPSPYPDDKNDNSSNNNPPRYANDFHQGRRNRGYSYDPDPTAVAAAAAGAGRQSRYSSDEDGTADSRVNTSQTSLGYGNPTIGTPI